MPRGPTSGARASSIDFESPIKRFKRDHSRVAQQERWDTSMTEKATLERKRLSDLHQIASQLGIKQYRKYRKPELAEMIYQVATEQAGQTDGQPAPEATSDGQARSAGRWFGRTASPPSAALGRAGL